MKPIIVGVVLYLFLFVVVVGITHAATGKNPHHKKSSKSDSCCCLNC